MAAKRSSKFNAFKCLQPDKEEPHRHGGSLMESPVIALVNGLSGGRKGERVQEALQQNEIPTFDLMQLSLDQSCYKKFVKLLCSSYDGIFISYFCLV